MPITPFHFGPGALFKAAAPLHVGWTTFALANGLIDLEPILLFFFTGEPAHRFFHTLPGATLAALAAWPGRIACETWLRFWNRQLSPAQARWLGCPATISSKQAFIGANPWHGRMSVDGLHLLCATAALAALALWSAMKFASRK